MKSSAVAPAASGSAPRSLVSRTAGWMALVAVMAVLGLSSLSLYAESAASLFKRGASAEARDDYDTAFNYYQKAYAAAPKDLRYKAAFYRIRITASAEHVTKGRKLVATGDDQGALVELLRATEIDGGNEAAQQEIARIRQRQGVAPQLAETSLPIDVAKQEEIDSMGPPPELKPLSNEPLTLHMSEDAKVVYQAVGKAAGVNVLFDPDYASKRVQVDLNGVSLLDALRIVGTVSNTFWRPVTGNTLFVAQNTRAKRTELDEQAVQTYYLTNAWQANDLTDVNTVVRSVLPNVKAYAVPSQNAIVVRGTPDELLLAQKLINDLDKARPEVVVDIAVLEVSKNWERNIGLSWPSSASVALNTSTSSTASTSTSTTTSTTTSTAPTIYNLAHLKASDFAVTIGSAAANMLLNDSNTKILQNPRIRCTDQQKATMKIGSRIPIATGSYGSGLGGVSTGATAGYAGMVNTQFQYIDVGVNIEMTPTVHFDHDVTLKIKLEVSSENGSSTIEGVTEPIIAQKTSEQTIRLREGEASVLSGILNRQDQVSWSGVPGLSSIPGIKYLFGSKDHTITEDEIVFLMIPHVVRSHDLDAGNMRTIDLGVGQQAVDLRHVPTPAPDANPPSGSDATPVQPAPPARHAPAPSSMGTVPGHSAETAAPAALAQLRAAADANDAMPHPPAPALVAAAPPVVQPVAAAVPPAPAAAAVPPPAEEGLSLALSPLKGSVAVGAIFQVPVTLSGGKDIAAVPMQVSYDAAKLSLVNVDSGEFLGRDGQAIALVHRDDGPGTITLNAARPPGATGINGGGVVCVLVFKAKATGMNSINITRPTALNSAQQSLIAKGNKIDVEVK
jgi:general secretion pathway protein D